MKLGYFDLEVNIGDREVFGYCAMFIIGSRQSGRSNFISIVGYGDIDLPKTEVSTKYSSLLEFYNTVASMLSTGNFKYSKNEHMYLKAMQFKLMKTHENDPETLAMIQPMPEALENPINKLDEEQ